MAYASGDTVRVYGTFSVTGALIDPAGVTGKHKPSGVAAIVYKYPADAQLVRVSTGIYYFDVLVTAANINWYYRWEGSGSAFVADEGSFYVNPTQF